MITLSNWLVGLVDMFTLYGGGAKGGGNQTSTSYNSNLPEYAKPYYNDLLTSGRAEKNRPYVAYTGQRTQGFTPVQQSTMQNTLNLSRPSQFQGATDATRYGTQQALNTGKWTDPGQASQYMNPYMQNVVDIQQREATRQAGIQNVANDAMFAKSGAFGGARQGIVQAELQRNLMQQQGDIQAQGLNQAYQQGTSQYNADRSAGQQGVQLGLQGAQQLGQIGEATQATDLARLGAQGAVGNSEQALAQQNLNTNYENFINQRDFNRQNLNFYSGLLQGVPVSPQANSIQYTPQASIGQQVAGAGITAASLYKALN